MRLWNDERVSAGIARFVVNRRAIGWRVPTHMPMSGLVSRLGVCVVCSESVATVLMELCGHLALCAACAASWTHTTASTCSAESHRTHLAA